MTRTPGREAGLGYGYATGSGMSFFFIIFFLCIFLLLLYISLLCVRRGAASGRRGITSRPWDRKQGVSFGGRGLCYPSQILDGRVKCPQCSLIGLHPTNKCIPNCIRQQLQPSHYLTKLSLYERDLIYGHCCCRS